MKNIFKKFIQIPLIQIVIAVILINIITFIVRSSAQILLSTLPFSNNILTSIIIFCVRMTTVYYVYYFFVKIMEKRKALEIKVNKSFVKEFSFGALLAVSTLFVIIMIIWLTGNYSVYSINESAPLLESFFYHTFFAFLQDIIYFAVIFRIIEKYYGSWIAIIIASIIFGFKHLLFPGYTIWSVVAQTIEGGLLFSSFYIIYRKIGAIFGFHLVWNFIQYGIIQGFRSEGYIPLFNGDFSENLISGMPVGLEASIISFFILTSFGVYFLIRAIRKGMLLSP